MDLVDNNILIYSFRPEMKLHAPAKLWLEASLNGSRSLRLFPTVEVGFARLVTHPKLFKHPSMISEVREFLSVLCASPAVEIALWNPFMRDRWLRLCDDLNLSGNDCNDAMLAAVALEKNLRVVTFDRGFRRFPGLKLLLLGG